MGLRVTVVGVDTLNKSLTEMGPRTRARVERGFDQIGALVTAEARNLCDVDQGILRNSITWRIGSNQHGSWLNVGTDVVYAPHIEFGTGPRGRASNTNPNTHGSYHAGNAHMPPLEIIRAWCVRNGIPPEKAYAVAKKIQEEGLPARSFLYQAYRNTLVEVQGILLESAKKGLLK